MYDWYLDVNASLYGTRKGCEPLHPYYNRHTGQVELMNTTPNAYKGLTVRAEVYNREGSIIWEQALTTDAPVNDVKALFDVPEVKEVTGVYFLKLSLADNNQQVLTDNIYWLTTVPKDYSSLNDLPKAHLSKDITLEERNGLYEGTILLGTDSHISFFNRIKVFDRSTGKRILPVHYSDNYITLMPGDKKTIAFSFKTDIPKEQILIKVEGWNNSED